MKKYIRAILLTFACLLIFTLTVFAKDYTVTTNEEYTSAYEEATNGDTITVCGMLSCDIQATKSVTYILKNNWESSKINLASNIAVTFIADGGNYRITPSAYSTTDGWMNISTSYGGVVLNFGGINNGTLTFDGTKSSHDRVSYAKVSADITWNFLSGSEIFGFNATTKDTDDNACVIYARKFNMYSGSKIYGNNIVSAPLIKTGEFNMFGGEIFGNLLTSTKISSNSCGAIYVSSQLLITDGKISGNIFNSKSSSQINNVGFFTVKQDKTAIVSGLEVGVNYASGTGSNDISAMFGSSTRESTKAYAYYSSTYKMGTRKVFSQGTPTLVYDEELGNTVWQMKDITVSTATEGWTGFSWVHSKGLCDNMAIFLDASNVIVNGEIFRTLVIKNLFVIGVTITNGFNQQPQKNYTYSYTGPAKLTIPSDTAVWSYTVEDFCHKGEIITLSDIEGSMPCILYASYENSIGLENGTTACTVCHKKIFCENEEHIKNVTMEYARYDQIGGKVTRCDICNAVSTEEAPAIFTCLGYSTYVNGTGALTIGFLVNSEAIQNYKDVTGNSFGYGVFVALADSLGNENVFDENGNVAQGVINADLTHNELLAIELKLLGFSTNKMDVKLVIGAYVYTNDGENTEYSYIQSGNIQDGEKYFSASFNEIAKLTK